MEYGWITPFKKQCFVTSGIAINVAQFSIVMGYTAILLPQLRAPDSIVPIDDTSGSWIAAIPSFTLIVGNFTVSTIMAKYGRKVANLISIVPALIGWICIIFANNILTLLVARLLQGLSMGMGSFLGPILIGEYASPKNRGAFMATMTCSLALATLCTQTVGSFMSWKKSALVCSVITVADLLIVIFSPESPSWLADQGRYDECRKVFRWLRGSEEESELNKMLEASQVSAESKLEVPSSESYIQKVKRDFSYFYATFKKKEFYMPILITAHMYSITLMGGIQLLSVYTLDTFHHVISGDVNNALMIIALDSHRLLASIGAVFIIRKFNRRTMLFSTVSLTIASFFVTAAYTYARAAGVLPFDHPAIGIILIHIHIFTLVTGSLPLPLVIAGEIFPFKYKSLAGSISAVIHSITFFITVKTVPFLFRTIHVYGLYFLYGSVLCYCLVIAWLFLPETKDRTLQEIEEEFKENILDCGGVRMTGRSLPSIMVEEGDGWHSRHTCEQVLLVGAGHLKLRI